MSDKLYCTYCGALNEAGAIFCERCGHELEPIDVPAKDTEPAAEQDDLLTVLMEEPVTQIPDEPAAPVKKAAAAADAGRADADVLNENTQLGEVRVRNADEVDYVLVRPTSGYSCIWCDTIDINSVQQISDWKDEVEAPVKEGDKLGKVLLKYSGETLAEIDVVASSDVGRSFWKYNLSEIPGFFRSKYLKATWILGIVLSVLYIGACVFFTIRYHEDRKRRAAARAGHLNSQKK